MPAVILVFVKAVVTAVKEAMSIRVYIYPIHYYYNLTMAYAILPGFVCISLYMQLCSLVCVCNHHILLPVQAAQGWLLYYLKPKH